MITGLKFPSELETNRDLGVYRDYLQRKSLEPPSSYYSLILPTVAAGAFGAFVANRLHTKPLPLTAAAASIPAVMGYVAKRYDDAQLARATRLADATEEDLAAYLPIHIEKDKTLSPLFHDFNIMPALLEKRASAKSIKTLKGARNLLAKILLGTLGAGALLVGGSTAASQLLQPEKWTRTTDPLTRWSLRKPVIFRGTR